MVRCPAHGPVGERVESSPQLSPLLVSIFSLLSPHSAMARRLYLGSASASPFLHGSHTYMRIVQSSPLMLAQRMYQNSSMATVALLTVAS